MPLVVLSATPTLGLGTKHYLKLKISDVASSTLKMEDVTSEIFNVGSPWLVVVVLREKVELALTLGTAEATNWHPTVALAFTAVLRRRPGALLRKSSSQPPRWHKSLRPRLTTHSTLHLNYARLLHSDSAQTVLFRRMKAPLWAAPAAGDPFLSATVVEKEGRGRLCEREGRGSGGGLSRRLRQAPARGRGRGEGASGTGTREGWWVGGRVEERGGSKRARGAGTWEGEPWAGGGYRMWKWFLPHTVVPSL